MTREDGGKRWEPLESMGMERIKMQNTFTKELKAVRRKPFWIKILNELLLPQISWVRMTGYMAIVGWTIHTGDAGWWWDAFAIIVWSVGSAACEIAWKRFTGYREQVCNEWNQNKKN